MWHAGLISSLSESNLPLLKILFAEVIRKSTSDAGEPLFR
jgi:hypothetical protein